MTVETELVEIKILLQELINKLRALLEGDRPFT